MKIKHLFILSTIFFSLSFSFANGQKKYDFFDGPYLSEKGDSLEILWISNGTPYRDTVHFIAPYTFKEHGLPEVTVSPGVAYSDPFIRHNGVKNYMALSDVHGQYDVFLKLLINHGVIDQTASWSFGEGHLVIVGDVMDRGPGVTESLWLLYRLDQEAKAAGGKIHLLLGNHEMMVLHDDPRYINPKYRYTCGAFDTKYTNLFSDKTILGNWLRSKNISTVINKTGFVHGGFSPVVLEKESSLEKINDVFKKVILPKPSLINRNNPMSELLYFDNGPLWYRGYADPNGFDVTQADKILHLMDLNSIVVGHTSMPKIVPIHDNKIILVDSSIKFGKSGEILIAEQDSLFRGLFDGSRVALGRNLGTSTAKSPFQYVYDLEDTDLTIVLETNVGKLMGSNRNKEKYQPATLTAFHNGEFNRTWDVRLKTRGNMRKKVCRLPPLKIDFQKKTLDYLGFTANDKLKLVLPCKSGKGALQGLYREHIIYKMYQAIDTLGYRTHLVNVVLEEDGDEKYDVIGFFIEDEEEFALRTNSIIVEKGVLRDESILRSSYLKMVFFQYMILNTDFHVSNKHNLEIIKMPGEIRPRAIPYDFDYAGIINQPYAIPHGSLAIENVRDPLFRGQKIRHGEVKVMKVFFNEKRTAIEKVILEADYLSKNSKSFMLKDVERFYDDLNNEGRWKRVFNIDK